LQTIIVEERGAAAAELNVEVVKLPVFNRKASKIRGLITAYKLYLKMRIRGAIVEKQIQWILLYVQEGSANIWKENLLEDLKTEEIEFESAGEFLLELKEEFNRNNEELVKVAELKKVE